MFHTTRTHSRDDVLTRRQFEQLLEATYDINDPYDIQCRFALVAAGTLGMRAGEIAHCTRDWVDMDERTITIPPHDPCDNGQRDGDVCGYCRTRAQHHVDAMNVTIDEAKQYIRDQHTDVSFDDETLTTMATEYMETHNITIDDALDERWQPKTPAAVRSIPFDFDTRAALVVESFFDTYDQWPASKCTLNRRIDRAHGASSVDADVYPHALRATAASQHASRGVSAYALMSVMGWSDIGTARAYIQSSDEAAANEIRAAHH